MTWLLMCAHETGVEVLKSYPDGALKISVYAGRNTFVDKRIDEIIVGDLVCHYPGRVGATLEVTQVEEI